MPTFDRAATALAIPAALTLSACGDGSSVDTPPRTTFGSRRNDFDPPFGTFAVDTPVTAPLQMPRRGEATYYGAARHSNVDRFTNDIINNPKSASRVQLTADFGSSGIGGRLYDCRATDPNISMNGDLTVANGQIISNLFNGTLKGTVTVNGMLPSYTGGQVVGNFRRAQADAVSGMILQGSSATRCYGVFVADR